MVSREERVARQIKPALHACALGWALVLLCACAQQHEATVTPESARRPVKTPVATRVLDSAPWLAPSPSAGPVGEARADTPSRTDAGPAAADLEVQVFPGEAGTHTLVIRNLGPDPATDILLADRLSGGVTALWAGPTQPVCGRQGRGVSCDLGDLHAGATAAITLDLSAGGTETPITGTQPAGVTLAVTSPSCAVEQGGSRITCRLDRLDPGAEVRVQAGIQVDSGLAGPFVQTATLTAREADLDLSNNQHSSTIAAGATGTVPAAAGPTTTDLVIQAQGPTRVVAGQPFTYTYTITNRGESGATRVWFQDSVPPDMNLLAYTPALPLCEQQGDTLTCTLHDPISEEAVTVSLVVTGHGGQPMWMGLERPLPGWPVCVVVKERTWQWILECELGDLYPGQATRVQLVLAPVGERERTSVNTASVRAVETDLAPADNTSTVTITIQAGTGPESP